MADRRPFDCRDGRRDETPEQQNVRVGKMIRENVDKAKMPDNTPGSGMTDAERQELYTLMQQWARNADILYQKVREWIEDTHDRQLVAQAKLEQSEIMLESVSDAWINALRAEGLFDYPFLPDMAAKLGRVNMLIRATFPFPNRAPQVKQASEQD